MPSNCKGAPPARIADRRSGFVRGIDAFCFFDLQFNSYVRSSKWRVLVWRRKSSSVYELRAANPHLYVDVRAEPSGIAVVVFAHKSTAGWEAQLEALINAGLTVTASWPIDTEMGSRLRAKGSAALASSTG